MHAHANVLSTSISISNNISRSWTETWCVAFAIISLYRVLATGPGFVSPIYHPPNGEIDPVAEDYAIEPCISCRVRQQPTTNDLRSSCMDIYLT